ncbi:MAG: ABC-type transport auxiliary lipoprotein family protein [Pseudomonadota bacterium]
MRSSLLLLLTCLSLAGCSAIAALDRAAATLDVHEIRAPSGLPTAGSARGTELVVEIPTASGAIDTDRIVVRTGGTQVAYLPDARWSAAAPLMLQGAMVETFLRTDAFGFVGRRPLGASGDIALVSTLIDFGAVVEPAGDTAVVEVTLVARLVREADAAVLARRTFRQAATVPDTSSEAIIAGYATASAALLEELAPWVVGAAR